MKDLIFAMLLGGVLAVSGLPITEKPVEFMAIMVIASLWAML